MHGWICLRVERANSEQECGRAQQCGAWFAHVVLSISLLCALLLPLTASAATGAPALEQDDVTAAAASGTSQIEIPAPPNSGFFGQEVEVLPNGNFIVTDSDYNDGSGRVGMVYLYDGATYAQISSLRVNEPGDISLNVWITLLADGNFVVVNYLWDNASTPNVGAVRWCSGATGCSGTMTSANALIGSTAEDMVGYYGITPLPTGAYAVASREWDNGGAMDAGAVTWCPAGGCVGVVSAANSLLGATAQDYIGLGGIYVLDNGNFVVASGEWDRGVIINAGAATWCSGAMGCPSTVTAANSLVGSQNNDKVGHYGIVALGQGKYVVRSPDWANGGVANAGAVTPCSGIGGCTGTISIANSLVGTRTGDYIGNTRVTPLTNGGYVVSSINYGSNTADDVGAATFCAAGSPCVGHVNAVNSLVGTVTTDHVGQRVTPLPNGNFVVTSYYWNNGAATRAGAVTFCSGATGCAGTVTPVNSLVGSTSGDIVGSNGIAVLANGDYVVGSTEFDNGLLQDVGAATLCSGTTGCSGAVNVGNSLIGASANDSLGYAVPHPDGSYFVAAGNWDDGPTPDVGLVLRCSAAGCTGVISDTGGFKGSQANDNVGDVRVLSNGNYIIVNPGWDNGALVDAGAVTWCDNTSPCEGTITPTNSLVGANTDDGLGSGEIDLLSNGRYIISSPYWGDGTRLELGAVTLLDGSRPVSGTISSANSVLGDIEEQGYNIIYEWNATHSYVVVGLPDDNRVVLLSLVFPLRVELAGTGTGTVQSSPAGFTCASNLCTGNFSDSTVVTLTAVANASSTFTGWQGACTGGGSCVVTMDRARQVRAEFTINKYPLTITKGGTGQGIVNSAAGIACGADCTETLNHGTVVTLTATAEASSDFAGWGGACTGTGVCSVVLDGPKNVAAAFTLKQLQVTLLGSVTGGQIVVQEMSAAEAGVASPAATYPYGTVLRFTAIPDANYAFDGWAGDLSGSQNPLEQTLTGPLNVGANFTPVSEGEQAPGNERIFLPTIMN